MSPSIDFVVALLPSALLPGARPRCHPAPVIKKQALVVAKLESDETQTQKAWSALEPKVDYKLIRGSQWEFFKTFGAAYFSLRIITSLTSVLQETPEIGVNHKDVQDAC